MISGGLLFAFKKWTSIGMIGLNDEIDGKMQTRFSHKIKKTKRKAWSFKFIFCMALDVVLENGVGFDDHFNVGYAAIFGSFDRQADFDMIDNVIDVFLGNNLTR